MELAISADNMPILLFPREVNFQRALASIILSLIPELSLVDAVVPMIS
jgi:hypothetical protein